jgi:hypothetical protein
MSENDPPAIVGDKDEEGYAFWKHPMLTYPEKKSEIK